MVIVSPLCRVIPLPNGLNGLQVGVTNVTKHLLTRDDPPSNPLYNPNQPWFFITAKCLLLLQPFQRRQRRHRGWQWRRRRRRPGLWDSGGRTHGNKPAANGDEDARYLLTDFC